MRRGIDLGSARVLSSRFAIFGIASFVGSSSECPLPRTMGLLEGQGPSTRSSRE